MRSFIFGFYFFALCLVSMRSFATPEQTLQAARDKGLKLPLEYRAIESPIEGFVLIGNPNDAGEFPILISADAELLFMAKKWAKLEKKGLRYLAAPEDLALRSKLIAKLKTSRLASYKFGDGSKKVFLFSAFDCPVCRGLQTELLKKNPALDTTVYVLHSNLRANDSAAFATAGALWCATDPKNSWEVLTSGRKSTSTEPTSCPAYAGWISYLIQIALFPPIARDSVPRFAFADGTSKTGFTGPLSEALK
jgi:hypothetical protein